MIGLLLASVGAAQEAAVPLPPPRPDRPAQPAEEPDASGAKDTVQTSPDAEASDKACLERIAKMGLRFEVRPAVQSGACSVKSPVLLSALADGVEVSPASLMECALAEGLARWTKDVVAVAAERHLQSAPKKLFIGTSYQCRDQRSGGKLSEHGLGNGVDVMGFEFAKRPPLAIATHAEGSPEAAFQGAVRTGACPVFSTVLGPGSDAAHGEHLHLDMRARKGNYRICQ